MHLLPLKLDVEYQTSGWATLGLVFACGVGAWLVEQASPGLVGSLWLDPANLRPWQFLTSTLLHDGFGHFLFNALYLWVFGRYVEERLGSLRFLALFFAFGAAGDAVYLLRGGALPSLGASGAVAGCLGLVFFTAPRMGVRFGIGYGAILRSVRPTIPAWVLIGIWLLGSLASLWVPSSSGSGINHVAHVGGFLAGCLTTWVLRAPWLRGTPWALPRERGTGSPVPANEVERSEVVWRTLYERQRAAQAAASEGGVRAWRIDPPTDAGAGGVPGPTGPRSTS